MDALSWASGAAMPGWTCGATGAQCLAVINRSSYSLLLCVNGAALANRRPVPMPCMQNHECVFTAHPAWDG